MPCTGCGVDFGRFKREHGCKNCGYAFCSNCLTKKAPIRKLGDKKHSVCNTCFDILTGKRSSAASSGNISPPAALQKRLDAFHEKQTSHSQDQQLMSRLDKLREEKRGRIPTDKELEERLAHLKGTPISSSSPSSQAYFKPDHQTAPEQSSALLNQVTEEIALDAKRVKPEDEIAHRLQQLRGTDDRWNDLNKPGNMNESSADNAASFLNNKPAFPKSESFQNLPPNIAGSSYDNASAGDIDEVHKLMEAASKECQLDAERNLRQLQMDKELQHKLMELRANQNKNRKSDVNDDDEDDEDENKFADKLIEKLLAENELEESCSDVAMKEEKKELNTPNSENSSESEELPWCTICNEDATIRCNSCEGELYCHRCFKECHDTPEYKNHTTSNYKPPKK